MNTELHPSYGKWKSTKFLIVIVAILTIIIGLRLAQVAFGTVGTPISNTTLEAKNPAIAYATNSSNYGLVWEEEGPSSGFIKGGVTFDTMFRLIDLNGTPFISSVRLMTNTQNPSIAYNSQDDQFLVIGISNNKLYGQYVTSSGVASGKKFLISSSWTSVTSANLTFNPSEEMFQIVWVEDAEGASYTVKSAFYAQSAFIDVGDTIVASSSNQLDSPSISVNDSGEAHVVWANLSTDTIESRKLASNGSVSGSIITLHESGLTQPEQPTTRWNSNSGAFLTAWKQYNGAIEELVYRAVDTHGNPIAPQNIIATPNDSTGAPTLSTVANDWVLLWDDTVSDDVFRYVIDGNDYIVSDEYALTNGSGLQESGRLVEEHTTSNPLLTWTKVDGSSSVIYVNLLNDPIQGPMIDAPLFTELGNATSFVGSVASGTNVLYEWDFGDDQSGVGANVDHTYPQAGIYDVTLTASNAVSVKSITSTFFVEEPISDVVITTTSPVVVDEDVQLSYTAGSGGATNSIVAVWTVGEWQIGSGSTASTSFSSAGSYPVFLSLTNPISSYNTSVAVIVEDEISGLEILGDLQPIAERPVTFYANINTGSNVSYTWDFGNGDILVDDEFPDYEYLEEGTYTVELTADNGASSQTTSAEVTVQPPPKYWWDDNYRYRLPLTLSSTQPIGSESPELHAVTITLDTAAIISNGQLKEDGADLRIIYEIGGEYQLRPFHIENLNTSSTTLTFTLAETLDGQDDHYWLYYGNNAAVAADGLRFLAPNTTAIEQEIIGEDEVPSVALSVDEQVVFENQAVTFDSEISPDTPGTSHWDFGDGNSSSAPNNVSHSYSISGIYSPTLTFDLGNGTQLVQTFIDYIYVLKDDTTSISAIFGVEEIHETSTAVQPGQSIQIESTSGQIIIDLPANAFSESVVLEHQPHAYEQESLIHLERFSFSATAIDGTPISEANEAFEVSFDLSPYNLSSTQLESSRILFWNTESQLWQTAYTTVDLQTQTVSAPMVALTHVAVATNFGGGDAVLPHIPGVASGGVDLFTGTASFQLPIRLPQGRNNVMPNLGLAYNSGVADVFLYDQSGMTGMGFSLTGLGWIGQENGQWFISLNGVSEPLLQRNDSLYASESYRLTHVEFLDSDSGGNGIDDKFWKVTTSDGTQYYFGESIDSILYSSQRLEEIQTGITTESYSVVRYNLKRVVDPWGNEWKVDYDSFVDGSFTETLDGYAGGSTGAVTFLSTISFWYKTRPSEIIYTSNPQYGLQGERSIVFEYGQPIPELTNTDGNRLDTPRNLKEPFENGAAIGAVWHDALLNIQILNEGEPVLEYHLDYNYWSSTLFPPQVGDFGPDYFQLMLMSVTERTPDGDNSLTTHFNYQDTGHLNSIINPFGAEVFYTYQKVIDSYQFVIFNASGEMIDPAGPDIERWMVSSRSVVQSYAPIAFQTFTFDPVFVNDYIEQGLGSNKYHQFLGNAEAIITNQESDTTYRFLLGEYGVIGSGNADLYLSSLAGRLRFAETDGPDSDGLVRKIEYLNIHPWGVNGERPTRICEEVTINYSYIQEEACFDYDEANNISRVEYKADDSDLNAQVSMFHYETSDDYGLTNRPNLIERFVRNESSSLIRVEQSIFEYDYFSNPNGEAVQNVLITRIDESPHNSLPIRSYIRYSNLGNIELTWEGNDDAFVEYEYDLSSETYLELKTFADLTTEQYQYHPVFNTLISHASSSSVPTTWELDGLGMLESTQGPEGRVNYTYSLDSGFYLIEACHLGEDGSEDDYQINEIINGLGWLIRTERLDSCDSSSANKISVSYAYDDLGRRTHTSMPYDGLSPIKQLATDYDALGRVLSQETIDGTLLFDYDNYQTITKTDARGIETIYEVDGFNRVIEQRNTVDGVTIKTEYEYRDWEFELEISGSQRAVVGYDGFGNVRVLDDADRGVWSNSYNSRGQIQVQTDARGVVTTYLYDEVGRPEEIQYDSSNALSVIPTSNVTFDYANGLLKSVTTDDVVTTYLYDSYARMERFNHIYNGLTLSGGYHYDAHGNVDQIVYPDGEIVSYTFDSFGRESNVTGAQTYLEDVIYNPNGQIESIDFGQNVTQTITLSPDSFRPTIISTFDNGDIQTQLDLNYNSVGLLETHSVNGVDYNTLFDELNRPEHVSGSAITSPVSYVYDTIGNLEHRGGLIYHYGNKFSPQPHLPISTNDGRVLSYDDNGNLISQSFNDAPSYSYQYDAANRLAIVTLSDNSTPSSTRYVYDGIGNRISIEYPDGTILRDINQDTYVDISAKSLGHNLLWSSQETPSSAGCVALDRTNVPAMLYKNNDELMLLWNNDSYQVPVQTGVTLGESNLTFNDRGEVVVTWSYEGDLSGEERNLISYAIFNNGEWIHHQTIYSSNLNENTIGRLLVESLTEGSFDIIFVEDSSAGYGAALKHINVTENIASPANIVPGSELSLDGLFELDLAKDDAGNLHIIWGRGQSQITTLPVKYTLFDGVDFSEPEVIGDGIYFSITVTDDGQIMAGMFDDYLENLSTYLKPDGNSPWSLANITDQIETPQQTALASNNVFGTILFLKDQYQIWDGEGWSSSYAMPEDKIIAHPCQLADGPIYFNASVTTNDTAELIRIGYIDIYKRYLFNGQAIGYRTPSDEIYQHLYDPTGQSIQLWNTSGSLDGTIRFDNFDTHYTGHLPDEVLLLISQIPDQNTGLIYLGDGQYYEPSLAKTLHAPSNTHVPASPSQILSGDIQSRLISNIVTNPSEPTNLYWDWASTIGISYSIGQFQDYIGAQFSNTTVAQNLLEAFASRNRIGPHASSRVYRVLVPERAVRVRGIGSAALGVFTDLVLALPEYREALTNPFATSQQKFSHYLNITYSTTASSLSGTIAGYVTTAAFRTVGQYIGGAIGTFIGGPAGTVIGFGVGLAVGYAVAEGFDYLQRQAWGYAAHHWNWRDPNIRYRELAVYPHQN